MRKFLLPLGFSLVAAFVVIGCDKAKTESSKPAPPSTPGATAAASQTVTPAGFLLDKAPDGTKDLAAVKLAGVKDGDEVVVRGIVGGSEAPFLNNRAVVQIIDPSVTTCDKMPGESCKTPWDACCHQDDAKAKGATVQVVDSAGSPLKGTLEGVGGLKPLSEVIVRGKAKMEGGKSLIIDATAMYVRR